MLKPLLKKQFLEIFRGSQTKKKKHDVGNTVALIIVFLVLAAMFFTMFWAFVPLLNTDFAWIYYAFGGIFSITMGVFGSVFTTYNMLYQSKDNDLLLAMPIPTKTLLIARLLPVFCMSGLYSAVVWLAAILPAWIQGKGGAVAVCFQLLLTVIIALLVTILTCLLGWIVAYIVSKVRRKNVLVTIVSLVFLALYFRFVSSFNFDNATEAMLANAESFAATIQGKAFLFYELGLAALGSGSAMLLVSGLILALSALGFFILDRTFLKLTTTKLGAKKATYKAGKESFHTPSKALFLRELKRFFGLPTYLLNCGLGLFLMPILGVLAIIKRNDINQVLNPLSEAVPDMAQLLPLAVVSSLVLILGINAISTPSVSLEGKNLWLVKSLPVSPASVLLAKENVHVVLNGIAALVTSVLLCIAIRLPLLTSLLLTLFLVLFCWFTGAIGLIIGVLRPNFQWTSEVQPIKQSANVLYSWFASYFGGILLIAPFVPLRNLLSINVYFVLATVVLVVICILLNRWITTRGAKRFTEY